MGLISKIYNSNQILFKAGNRKGKTRSQIALMVEQSKDKKSRNKKYISILQDRIAQSKSKEN